MRPAVQLTQVPRWLYVWVPIVTSLSIACDSLWSVVIATSEPEGVLVLPGAVASRRGSGANTLVYVQPSFLGTTKNRPDRGHSGH